MSVSGPLSPRSGERVRERGPRRGGKLLEDRQLTGSLAYRRFCRIDAGKAPDAKTMVRLGQVGDGPTLRQLLHRLVTGAAARSTAALRRKVVATIVTATKH